MPFRSIARVLTLVILVTAVAGCPPGYAPVLNSPPDGSTLTSAKAYCRWSWQGSEPRWQEIAIKTDADFTRLDTGVVDRGIRRGPFNSRDLSLPEGAYEAVPSGTTLYWSVRAVAMYAEPVGDWAEPFSFVYDPQLPEMLLVPASSFDMGDPWGEGEADERPVHTVALSAYEIGRFEVTNREYADALNWANGQGYLDDASSATVTGYGVELLDIDDASHGYLTCQISWNGREFVVDSRDGYSMAAHPVVEVSWYGAVAYCNWLSEMQHLTPVYDTGTWTADFSKDGYHLPTEAQWERAAAWDPETPAPTGNHWRYGFISDTLTGKERCNYRDSTSHLVNPLGLTSRPCTSPVGWFDGVNVSPNGNTMTQDSPSPVGAYDMSGNVREWCHDRYGHEYYQTGGPPWTDPTGYGRGECRVCRGGAYDHPAWSSASRDCYQQDLAGLNLGFRLARQH